MLRWLVVDRLQWNWVVVVFVAVQWLKYHNDHCNGPLINKGVPLQSLYQWYSSGVAVVLQSVAVVENGEFIV